MPPRRRAPQSSSDDFSLSEAGPVEKGVQKDLRALPKSLQGSTLAATALTLARALDAGAGLSTAAIARELRAHMTELLASRDAEGEQDQLAAIRNRRAAGS